MRVGLELARGAPCSYDIYISVSHLLSVSIPDDLMAQFERQARERGLTKSELAREALRREIDRDRWAGVFRAGEQLAERAGIGPEDVEAIVDQVRAEMARGH